MNSLEKMGRSGVHFARMDEKHRQTEYAFSFKTHQARAAAWVTYQFTCMV
jgi:hypothetical protein